MKAVVCTKYGSPEVLRLTSCNKPTHGDDQVLIRIRAASVTNSDIFIRSSKVSYKFIIPFRLAIGITRPRNGILGQVFAGDIAGIGKNIKRFKVGDKVYGLTGFSLGAYAEFKTMGEVDSTQGCLSLMPQNCSFEEATSAAYGGLLALQFLEKKQINKNDKVLIYGASGTSGTFALQYLKSLGAEVTGVCRENKFDFVKSLGATKVLDYANDESISCLETYGVIFDCVGKAKKSRLRVALSKHIGNKKDLISIDDEALLLSSPRLERIRALIENNSVRPITDRIFPLEEIVEAHRYVELGHKKGNVAITI